MNISEVSLLINAGFTKSEIMAIMSDPQPAADPEPSGDPAPAPDPEPAGEMQNAIDGLQKTVNDLLKTVKAMQADNVKKASGGKAEIKTSDDVIKDFFTKS